MRAKLRAASVVFVALFVMGAVPGVASASMPWNVQRFPWTIGGPLGMQLNGISCASGMCMAVGDAQRSGDVVPLAEIRDSAGWSQVPTPTTSTNPPIGPPRWAAVSCTSPTFCVVVGEENMPLDPVVGETDLLGMVWNGSTWTTTVLSNYVGLVQSALTAISCSGTTCVAVGSTGDPPWPIVEELSAGVWSGGELPCCSITSDATAEFSSVSCSDPTDCTAVGEDSKGNAVVDTLSGGTWTSQLVEPPTGDDLEPSSVSCWGPSECDAVGTWNLFTGPPGAGSDPSGLLLQISGSSTTVSQVPGLPSLSQLGAVSCVSAEDCIAVGSTDEASNEVAVSAALSGATWTISTLPSNTSSTPPYTSLGCSSTSSCEVVGGANAAALSGSTWTIDDPPALDGPPLASLAGLACPYAGHCIAVGSFTGPTQPRRPFVETLNSDTWSLSIPNLPVGAVTAELSGVSCPGPHDCVAVGSWTDTSDVSHPYADLMTRGTWTAIPLTMSATTPNPQQSELNDISCSSDTECVAVGASVWGEGGGGGCGNCAAQPIVAELNGTTWATAYLPGPFGLANSAMLTSVSCWATRHCDAVGLWWEYGQPYSQGLVETLNGGWHPSRAPSPKRATEVSLNGISCSAANACQIVGVFQGSAVDEDLNPIQFPLFESGTSSGHWVLQRPSGTPAVGWLDAIACPTATTCAAVGSSGTKALTATLSNGRWSVASARPPSGYGSVTLSAVACLPFSGCESDGQAVSGAGSVPVWAVP
jgi:hypothetical protein